MTAVGGASKSLSARDRLPLQVNARDTLLDDRAAQARRLRGFLAADIPVSAAGTLFVFAVALVFPVRSVLVVGIAVLLNTLLLGWAWRRVGRGDVRGTVLAIALGLGAVTLVVAYFLPFILPIVILIPLLPVALTLPYLSGTGLRNLMVLTTALAGLAAVLSVTVDARETLAVLPRWLVDGAIMVGTPVLVGTICVALWQYFTRLQEALARAREANLALRESERLLEAKVRDRTRELADARDEAIAATAAKSTFLANMSHELRTPLNAIIGFSEVLAEGMGGQLTPKQAEYLSDILESARHLLALINDILDLSKVEAGRMELEVTSFSASEVLRAALTLVRERATRRTIALRAEIADDVGVIEGDERKLKQAVLNLLSNAVKFTPDGGQVELRARIADGRLEVAVRDTGVGISTADVARIFEEFQQAGGASGREEGTGLGLTLTKRFVELHGGRISVESAPGHGSTFTVSLPVGQRGEALREPVPPPSRTP